MRTALTDAVDTLEPMTADALLVHGFVPRLDDHYQVIADRWNAAETAGVRPLL